MKHGAVLQRIIARLAEESDRKAVGQELKSFVTAVYEHHDVESCIGNACLLRAEVHRCYERLVGRGIDADDLMALMDLVEGMQGHDQVLSQLIRNIDVQLCPAECQPA